LVSELPTWKYHPTIPTELALRVIRMFPMTLTRAASSSEPIPSPMIKAGKKIPIRNAAWATCLRNVLRDEIEDEVELFNVSGPGLGWKSRA